MVICGVVWWNDLNFARNTVWHNAFFYVHARFPGSSDAVSLKIKRFFFRQSFLDEYNVRPICGRWASSRCIFKGSRANALANVIR
jgi:hypothetical protein